MNRCFIFGALPVNVLPQTPQKGDLIIAADSGFERLKERTGAHMFNMFILRRDHLDAYCTWLFDILFELERRVDASQYDSFHARFFGRVSELLLDVWLEQNPLDCATAPIVGMEKTNWIKKGGSFLLAKFFGKKYGKSF